jgi:hypothetical protein
MAPRSNGTDGTHGTYVVSGTNRELQTPNRQRLTANREITSHALQPESRTRTRTKLRTVNRLDRSAY